MEELVDIYDAVTGEKTNKVISKTLAHKKGTWHSSIHIIIINKNKSHVLLQKRCAEKKLYPNMWDITVGGHISAGEDPITSAKRELTEELGLEPNNYKFNYIEKNKEELLNNGINSKEIVFIYTIIADIDINKITLQKEEVSAISWFNKKEFLELINKKQIIPHEVEFKIINKILN